VVALVVEGVVQRGRGVVDLLVQLGGRRRAGIQPIVFVEEADQRVQRGRDRVTVVLEQCHGAREPHGEGVGYVPAGPVPEPPVDAVFVVERSRYQRRLHRDPPPAGPHDDVQPQAVADGGVLLQIVGAEHESHSTHLGRPLRSRSRGAPEEISNVLRCA
jgi:hypothetical protein